MRVQLFACIGFILIANDSKASEVLERLSDKKPMIKRSFRPLNFESTIEQLDQDYTPNDAFFVRSHAPNLPKINLSKWRLTIGGDAVKQSLSLSYKQLISEFKKVELSALVVCSGNRRARFEPQVQGVQWKDGAVGNAKWMGVRLKDVLQRAGIQEGAVEVAFNGSDFPNLEKTPDFEKSIPISKALDDNTLLAFKMNGVKIPEKHGFPLRLIVPGWTATYWIKHLSSIRVLSKPFEGYWMKKAYRITKGQFEDLEVPWKGQQTAENTPITEIIINSQITYPREGDHLKKNQEVKIHGYAWDGGHGIQSVDISFDQGVTWRQAQLGRDLGPYSWRPFYYNLKTPSDGEFSVMSRATNGLGKTQKSEVVHNKPGYHHNSPVAVRFTVGGDFKLAKPKIEKTRVAHETLELKDAPGRDLVMANCLICHSAEYISMNSGFLDEKGWAAVVQKMQKMLGAPISDQDAMKITAYLTKNYGL